MWKCVETLLCAGDLCAFKKKTKPFISLSIVFCFFHSLFSFLVLIPSKIVESRYFIMSFVVYRFRTRFKPCLIRRRFFKKRGWSDVLCFWHLLFFSSFSPKRVWICGFLFCVFIFVEYSPKEIKLHAHIIVRHFRGYKHPNFADKTLMRVIQKWWGMVVR